MTKPVPAPAAEQLAAFTEAARTRMRPMFERAAEQMRSLHTAMKPLVDMYEQYPELFEQSVPDPGSCHCLCGRHPNRPGVCTGSAEPGMAVTFNSPTVGPQRVQMCRHCHNAHTGIEAGPDMAELEAITDTCACHCWISHPDKHGVCEAASATGMTVDGKPACRGCATAGR